MKDAKREEYIKDASKLIKDANDKKIKSVGMLTDVHQIIPARKNSKYDQIKRRVDGWLNLYTGIGTSRDKTIHTTFSSYEYLDDTMLSDLLVGDGFAQKISKAPANDMTREWVTVNNDDENEILNKLKDLKSEKLFNLAIRWKRHFGGSIIIMGINDGRELHEPVDTNNIKSVDYLRVYDRTNISLTTINFMAEPNDPHYGEPEFYTVTPKYSAPYNVHWTRCLVFKGEPVPNNRNAGTFWYWGMSVLQPIWDQIKDLGGAERNISKLLYEFVIGKYKIKGLSKLMAENKWEQVKKMIDIIDLGKSSIQALLLDADGDDFSRDSANVSGLDKIVDRFMMFLSGVADIPVTKLFGRSAAGENATGEGDEKNYYADIRSQQKNDLIPEIQILVDYINISKEFKGKQVEDPTVEANPLFQETQEQIMSNRKTQAEIDNIYITQGVLFGEEVRESRFSNGYSFDTTLVESEFGEEELEVEIPEEEENMTGQEEESTDE